MTYIVTDLTLMGNGNACLACLEERQFSCVRPLFNPTLYKQIVWYEQNNIRQGTKLDLTLLERVALNPHTEDATCTGMSILGEIDDREMQTILENSSYFTVDEGFGTSPIVGEKYFHHDCALPSRSIITLKIFPQHIILNQDSYKLRRIRATITDANDFTLSWIPVTDLRYVNVSEENLITLNISVQQENCIYVRLGLTRCYSPRENQNGYWLQANGIYIY